MAFLLFECFCLFSFLEGTPQPPPLLGLPPAPSRALVWAFLLVPLAQPSLLETFLRLSPFPATCLLLPAGLRSLEQLLPTQPATLTPCRPSPFLCKFKEPDFLLLSFLRPTPVGGSCFWIVQTPAGKESWPVCWGCRGQGRSLSSVPLGQRAEGLGRELSTVSNTI